MFYTGVGSRETPAHILKLMTTLATCLKDRGYILRSGGAIGADTAFETGAGRQSCIYYARDATAAAMEIAARYHPAWHKCSELARKLHGRNAFQVLGRDLNQPSQFLVCWTPDGAISHAERCLETGGTGTAISIDRAYDVPVFNLGRPEHLKRIVNFAMP